ncbi:MAG TPA: FtsL-like putative cell division protein [Ferruginibacter sp.]|nr:FtsL-like putative cell division protein [Ferruginibacter sp.]
MTEENKIQETTVSGQKTDTIPFGWKRFLSHKWVVRNIPFFLFLAALAVIYIYNGHYADKLARKISTTEKHIKELEYEYKTVKSEVIFRSKASELIKAVEPLGLKELTAPPILLGEIKK